MAGARETVAKAAALECMRSAHRHGRKCFLYAFSGPSQVRVDLRSVLPSLTDRLNPRVCHKPLKGLPPTQPPKMDGQWISTHQQGETV